MLASMIAQGMPVHTASATVNVRHLAHPSRPPPCHNAFRASRRISPKSLHLQTCPRCPPASSITAREAIAAANKRRRNSGRRRGDDAQRKMSKARAARWAVTPRFSTFHRASPRSWLARLAATLLATLSSSDRPPMALAGKREIARSAGQTNGVFVCAAVLSARYHLALHLDRTRLDRREAERIVSVRRLWGQQHSWYGPRRELTTTSPCRGMITLVELANSWNPTSSLLVLVAG